ncbi:30S ribosomal protein S11 [Candidatus Roizmanbacteria bacterium CG02_land_8_20_14_3_00_36_15]|uniref:Small ribosomal subunit protein uS11 n=2 Tax=Candidatus Roizmaniibacteriota TaxID=1752723 RepID=A0A2M8KLV3_9BACT|nr:MAG: 30S ribosomal protein S11 [Candidatus Roizmanbacteria bacterium CG03_land_8_20_14_0_80_36_21]PIV37873.1 MAG: 30S ribosomal protein S11 [Candidatus Roizmanbacteria bacterium CG02_land_8_20_14_3_00_36_15]PIY70168.1 MAG: 30S ribosomal protein S11 [Candidatus Roizmanbacteria bacterium CG_4_10_14_0_8_um_filter_36_36]PJA53646.1 MAG: 30S ribosomal protein S11 [Candidatus Roizmanbacteria bacterium CG_4_9_14_3_um_filter_36_11]PJC81681.1 MAG: 30S ribosomal protein S11 [Candidatus Roizmanbacteria 
MVKRNQKKIVERGRIYIVATFNNTMVTVTDEKGSPLVSGSSGMFGFSGTRKSTPYAATVSTSTTIKKAINNHGFRMADIFVKGIGPGREAALRAIKESDLEVDQIIDITPIPHNGVRPPKIRRV